VTAEGKPRLLCVDDEQSVLDGLSPLLRRQFDATYAGSGAAGLRLIDAGPAFAVVVSDMAMPGMDGAAFLAEVRRRAPDTTRILLTGYASAEAAVSAVNDGQIFRFLTKPCAPAELIKALSAGVEHHRLVTSERVLLEQTLRGCMQALAQVLSLAQPAAFGRATRAQHQISALCEAAGVDQRWEIEVAALLSQLGCVALPDATAERAYRGAALDTEERAMVARLPALVEQMIEGIPRMEGVSKILSGVAGGASTEWGPRALRAVLELDLLETQGRTRGDALAELRARGAHDGAILDSLARLPVAAAEKRELMLSDLRPGMVLADDVRTKSGTLLIARGHRVTSSLLERIRNMSGSMLVTGLLRVTDSHALPR
jgi:CheY-like chemotaxis protein